MNLEKDTYLFLRSKREPSTILVGLIPDFRLYQQDFLPYYIIYPISDFLLRPSHTPLFRSYSATSCEGCEGISFTPAGGAAHYASTRQFALESQELTDIQVNERIVKDHFLNFSVDFQSARHTPTPLRTLIWICESCERYFLSLVRKTSRLREE